MDPDLGGHRSHRLLILQHTGRGAYGTGSKVWRGKTRKKKKRGTIGITITYIKKKLQTSRKKI